MKTEKQTPLPWTFDETWSLIMSGNIEVAALHTGEAANVKRVNRSVALDNAAFIVRAVNNFDALVSALEREHAANLAILNVLRDAYDRFTDNDMQPANHQLKTWLASARVCFEHGSSEQTRAALKAAKGED